MRASKNFSPNIVSPFHFAYLLGGIGNMDVRSVEEWSKGAREVAVLDSRQQSPRVVERGGEHQLEESRYEPGLTLVDSGSDPRAWLALVQPSGTCAAHATSPDYLRHSPCSSTGSYHGEKRRLEIKFWATFQSNVICNATSHAASNWGLNW